MKGGKFVNKMTDFVPPGSRAHVVNLIIPKRLRTNYFTLLLIPTHAQLQRHRLKFIKNHLITPTCFGLRPSSGSYNILAKVTII